MRGDGGRVLLALEARELRGARGVRGLLYTDAGDGSGEGVAAAEAHERSGLRLGGWGQAQGLQAGQAMAVEVQSE